MKIGLIFFFFTIGFVVCQDDPTEILSVSVDGLLMDEASITASSTCGMEGPETFCRLVDEGQMMENSGSGSNVMCDICDDRNATKRHPIEYAKSGDRNLWWQSPSMAQGIEYERVNITIDLKQVYQIVYILLKMADSPRPGTWILERSIDGNTYLPWIFFSDTPYGCVSQFRNKYRNIKLTSYSQPRSLGDDEVFCTTYYSQPTSLNAGEIIISLINGRDSLLMREDEAPKSIPLKLINFLSARFIRFRFLKPLTLAADLMTHKDHMEKSIYNRYYYSLRNIEVGGKCICNNHADKCDKVFQNGISVAKCNCKHYTCGSNCEVCCPLFNQKPWRQGLTCEECNCNGKASKCHFNQTVATLQLSFNKFGQMDGGGVCEDCRENTEGVNCEKCQKGYYRPENVMATESFPCKKCACYGAGTNGACISNGEEIEPQKPGDCICKPGYTGRNCDRCSLGYQLNERSECVPCPCSIEGSVQTSMYRCNPPCNCKVNVDPSSNCHKCKQYFFNIDRTNPDGCQPCYCFGVTDQCSSLSALNLKISDHWYFLGLVHNLNDWKVTTLAMDREADPRTSSMLYPIVDNNIADSTLNNPAVYYWAAPKAYLGNWLTSYKSVLQYVIKIEKEPSISGYQIDNPDVIIKCGTDQIFHSISSEDTRQQKKVLIPLNQKYWRFVTPTGMTKDPTQDEFMSCLVDVRSMLIKGKYFSNQNSIGLLNVTLDRGDILRAQNSMPHIEKCDCPPGFSGLSCESCQVGYRRVNTVLVNGKCEQCVCYQHSNSCDPFTGECKNCLHNTTGSFCDICGPGFYGFPRSGDPAACKRCACPLEDYQLTNMCSTFEPSKYICHECGEKTGGEHCQRCIEGYFGNPLRKVPCRKCRCNDNEETCDTLTGQCRCSFNTMGSNCEICKHGFYGDALKKNCQSCNCFTVGSESKFCDKVSGLCPCKPTFSGRTCDKCQEGLYLKDQRCISCECNSQGRVSLKEFCDSNTGKCFCKEGISGKSCDRCLPNYYGFPDCKRCECSNHSLSVDCDPINGRCQCGRNVEDNKCSNCQHSFYWSSQTECSPCQCGLGSKEPVCDMNSGQCPCSPHVVGQNCDKCDFNYFGLSPQGCKKCPECFKGRVCNDEGECVCPMNTRGEYCQNCTDHSWGYNKDTGCKKCDCSKQGSLSDNCDNLTGQCHCRKGFQGQKCDRCAKHLFGFPKCRPCSCDQAGSLPHQPTACDPTTGRCPCKLNVEGYKCDKCKNGTFGLNGNYIAGCYSCFCSGRSTQCSALKDYRLISNGENKYDIFNDVRSFDVGKDPSIKLSSRTSRRFGWPISFYRPVFIDVTQLLVGPDLSLSYRSVLLTADIACSNSKCGREDTVQREVILESHGGLIELAYLINHTRPANPKMVVELSETSSYGQWFLTKYNNQTLAEPTNLGNEKFVNLVRDLFMTALINVTKVRLQLYTNTVNPDDIKVTLETFHPVRSTENIGKPVTSVEKCECDNKTVGSHCESPIEGYFANRLNLPEVYFNISVRIGIGIKMEVKKCFCNGHSSRCNKDSGYCFGCMNHTTGEKCELCSEGYFGDPRNNGQCFVCECPSKRLNYAKRCERRLPSGTFQCECREGFGGNLCTECKPEFYGDPSRGIECKRCDCNPDGSISSTCDNSGRCQCAAVVMGDKCDQCADNYVVEDKKCKDCLTGCTKELFVRVQKLNDTVRILRLRTLPSKGDLILKGIVTSITEISGNFSHYNRFKAISQELDTLTVKFKGKKNQLEQQLKDAGTLKEIYLATLLKVNEILKDIKDTTTKQKDLRISEELIINATKILTYIDEWKLKMSNLTVMQHELLSIQNHIDKINQFRDKIKGEMYLEKLQAITDLIEKTKLAQAINRENKEYLRSLDTILSDYESKLNQFDKQLHKQKMEYKELLDTKTKLDEQLTNFTKVFSEFEDKLKEVTKNFINIERLLKTFSNQTPSTDSWVISDDIRNLVQINVEKAQNLVKNLLKNFQILSKAEDAKMAYLNISRDIHDVEKAINQSSGQLEFSKKKLQSDIFSINTKGLIQTNVINKNLKEVKEKEFSDLFNEYNELQDNQNDIRRTNTNLSKIPDQTFDVSSLHSNISTIKGLQEDNKKTVHSLTKTLEAFELPKSKTLDLTDIKNKIEDLKKDYNGVSNETLSLIVSVKTLRESLKKIRERLQKRNIHAELAHGAAAKAPEPIRLDKTCVRHYKTYFLQKSSAFSLELYLNPQFIDQPNLILFGFDSSEGFNVSFALTMEKEKKFKFWYDNGQDSGDISVSSPILTPKKYIGLTVSWNLGKWIMEHKVMDEEKDKKFGTFSVNATKINNIFLGPNSDIFVGGFPSDDLLKRSGVTLGGTLMDNLRENYRTKYYKGCLYGVSVMQFDLGLQDVYNVEKQCHETKGAEFLLRNTFHCKISQSNTAFIEKSKNTVRRMKREVNPDYNIHFSGHGYMMINTTQSTEKSGSCLKTLNKAIHIYTFPQSTIHHQSFQFVLTFLNERSNFGFVLGQRNGTFHHGYWKGNEDFEMKDTKIAIDKFTWKTFDRKNILIFGTNELCDPQSIMYVGGIPPSDTRLQERLLRLKVPYHSYTGSVKITVVENDLFVKRNTRFVNTMKKPERLISLLPYHSLLIQTDPSERILLNHENYNDAMKKGFSVNVDFLGKPVIEPLTLITLSSERSKLSLKVSKDCEFTTYLNENLPVTMKEDDCRWEKYFVIVTLILTSNRTEIYMFLNKPNIVMRGFSVRMDSKVTRIEIGQPSILQPFYLYDVFLGEQLVNFNDRPLITLPVKTYAKLVQIQLSPIKTSFSKPPTPLVKNLRVSSRHGDILQSDAAATPHTVSNGRTYRGSIIDSNYILPSFQSQDYPLHSGWFDGVTGSMMTISGSFLSKYTKQNDNEISLRLNSPSTRPEMILSINFGPSKTLNLISLEGEMVLYDSLTKWNSTLRVPNINKKWHMITIRPSSTLDTGVLVKIDGHSFDFPDGPFSFTRPTIIEIGGYTGAMPIVYHNGKHRSLQMFTGCMDTFVINNEKVKFVKAVSNDEIKQCPRILEFFDNAIEIMSSYLNVINAGELLNIDIDNDAVPEGMTSLTIEFKFKFTGNEEGGLLVMGDGSKFCALVIKDKKLLINCIMDRSGIRKSASLDITENKWNALSCNIFHMPNILTKIKVYLNDKEASVSFNSDTTFSKKFLQPDIYLGGHPLLDVSSKYAIIGRKNFVGCLTDLKVNIKGKPVRSLFRSSVHTVPGRCSVDKYTYLRRI